MPQQSVIAQPSPSLWVSRRLAGVRTLDLARQNRATLGVVPISFRMKQAEKNKFF
jgi:hypothetical protein